MKKDLTFILGILLLLAPSVFSVDDEVSGSGTYVSSCSDGTAYGKCSEPGVVCWTSGLINVYDNFKEGNSIRAKCACSNFEGYIEKDNKCVKTTCEHKSKTYQDGDCISDSKPLRCVSGEIVDDATSCGCPEGQQADENGEECKMKIGCRWGTINCPPEKECKYVEESEFDDGKCVAKIGCVYGTVSCLSSEECDTSSDPDGECVKKEGCQYNNPKCPSGEKCNFVTGECVEGEQSTDIKVIGTEGEDQGDEEGEDNDTSTSNALVGDLDRGCCPCAPAAGGFVMVTMAILSARKKRV